MIENILKSRNNIVSTADGTVLSVFQFYILPSKSIWTKRQVLFGLIVCYP